MDREKATGEFKEYLALAGFTAEGVKKGGRMIRKFYRFLDEHGYEAEEMRAREARRYERWLIETGKDDGEKYAAGTIRNLLKVCSRFYEYLRKKGAVPDNPFLEIKKIKCRRGIPKNVLKEGEMNRLLRELSRYLEEEGLFNQIARYQAHVIAELQYATGLRIAEVAGLKEEDIDFDREIIRVRHGKGGKDRAAFLNEYACRILRLYCDEIRPFIMGRYARRNTGIFGSGAGHLAAKVNRVLREACSRLGCDKITTHGFRHSLGYHLLRSGCDIRYIQEILGHESLRTTEIYTQVDKEDLRQVLDEFHPRQWKNIRL
jgi:integrase/recombinase XerD